MLEITLEYTEAYKTASQHFKLTGNKLLVERIDLGEAKTKSGLIIADGQNIRADLRLQKAHIGYVLAVGEGYFDAETKALLPLDVKPGNVVVLNSLGVQYYSTVPGAAGYTANKVGLTTEGDVQMCFESVEAFKAYSEALSK